MNRKQQICLWLGIITIVLMGIFPPWIFSVRISGTTLRKNFGYKFILTPAKLTITEKVDVPEPVKDTDESSLTLEERLEALVNRPYKVEERHFMASIDFSRLCVQWAIVIVLTGGLLITFKDKKQKVEPPPSC